MTLALQLPAEKDEPSLVVSSIVRLDNMQRISRRSEAFEVYVLDQEGKLLAHPDPTRVAASEMIDLPETVEQVFQSYGTGLALEYEQGEHDDEEKRVRS